MLHELKKKLLAAAKAALPLINSRGLRDDLRHLLWSLPIDDNLRGPEPELAEETPLKEILEEQFGETQVIRRHEYEHKVRRTVSWKHHRPFDIDSHYGHALATSIITRGGDGSYNIVFPRRYLYPGEVQALYRALTMFMQEEAAIEIRDRKQDLKTIDRMSKQWKAAGKLTLTRREAITLLKIIKHRETDKVVEVKYGGKWITMARTDLKDDVCTTMLGATFDSYALSMLYGVRLRESWSCFAVVDSFSDG